MVNPEPVSLTSTRWTQDIQALAVSWQSELWDSLRLRVPVKWEATRVGLVRDLLRELPPLAVGFSTAQGGDSLAAGGTSTFPAQLPWVVLPAPLVLAILDRRLGGAGEWPRYARELSPLETKAFEPFARRLLAPLVQHLAGLSADAEQVLHQPVRLFPARPQLARYSGSQAGIVAFSCSWPGGHRPQIYCIGQPFASDGVEPADGASVQVELATVTLTLRDLMGLERGDVIRLPGSPTRPVRVCVQGHPRWLGLAGQCDGRLAVRLLKDWNPWEDEEDEPSVAVASRD